MSQLGFQAYVRQSCTRYESQTGVFLFHQVSYCEEKVDCRRVMIMGHFGERSFTQRSCNKTCDNCQNGGGLEHENKDVSQARFFLCRSSFPPNKLVALTYQCRCTNSL